MAVRGLVHAVHAGLAFVPKKRLDGGMLPSSRPSVRVIDPGLGVASAYDARFTEVEDDFAAAWPELHGRQPAPRRASDGA